MASITKHRSGWRAQVARKGVRKSKVFPTKQEARDWAAREERLILDGEAVAKGEPFIAVLDRYAREVSPGKRGHRWEAMRVEKLRADPLAKVPIGELGSPDLAAYRDRRLREVATATVLREMNFLGAVLTWCVKERGLIRANPMRDVRRPKAPQPRSRLPSADEIERLAHAAGPDLSTATARAFHAFLFAMETAMRAGEIVGMRWSDVDLERRVVRLPMTKNGRSREVPLSSEAVRLIEALPPADPVFGLRSAQLDALWRKLRARAGVAGLNFHDSRAEATLRLSRKVDALTLARITGHLDLGMLIRVYYRESAADIAKRLD